MAYIICEPCIGTKDTACVDVCPVDCIHPRKDEAEFAAAEMLYIHPDECAECGACEAACPVEAIIYSDDLTPENEVWKDIAISFFAQVGDPGGASALGPTGFDEPRVAALPVKS